MVTEGVIVISKTEFLITIKKGSESSPIQRTRRGPFRLEGRQDPQNQICQWGGRSIPSSWGKPQNLKEILYRFSRCMYECIEFRNRLPRNFFRCPQRCRRTVKKKISRTEGMNYLTRLEIYIYIYQLRAGMFTTHAFPCGSNATALRAIKLRITGPNIFLFLEAITPRKR